MRVPTRPRGPAARFNITPLIDIVFLLVIFFLVTAHFVRHQEAEAVELPSATQVIDEPESPRRLVVTIRADHSLVVGGRVYDLAQLEAIIRQDASRGTDDYEVQIRGDRSVPMAVIEPILTACARHGVTRVGFKVLAE